MDRADLQSFIAQSQDVLDGLFPGVIQMGGASYAVSLMGTDGSGSFSAGYHDEERDIKFRIRKSLHAPRPAYGTLIIYDGKEWKITEVSHAEHDDIAWHVTAETRHSVN